MKTNPRQMKTGAAVVIVLSIFLLMASCKQQRENYNVVYISMDTTRADYIDTGAGARAYTPAIKEFSKEAVVFDRAMSTTPLTLPAHLSILSSYLPHELGVLGNEYLYAGHLKMIQQVLQERGYYTAAVVSLGSLSSGAGFDIGFDDFHEDLFTREAFFVPAERVAGKALQMLETAKSAGPEKKNFFLFVHFSDPHCPYAPPTRYSGFQVYVDGKLEIELNAYQGAILRFEKELKRGRHTVEFKLAGSMDDFRSFVIRRLNFGKKDSVSLQHLTFSDRHYGRSYIMDKPTAAVKVICREDSSMKLFQVIPMLLPSAAVAYYRQEVEYMDSYIGKFLARLAETGLLEKTIVALFADHGEGLGERRDYFGHTRYLNQQFIHVPMIIRFPGIMGKHIEAPVSMAGLSPTVLDFMGIEDSSFYQRPGWLPLIARGWGKYKERPLYSFTFAPESMNDKLSVIRWPYQGIFYLDEKGRLSEKEIYNIALSQSFNHKDAFYQEVVKKNSIGHYKTFLREFAGLKKAFNRGSVKRMLADNQAMDRLSALGYFTSTN